MRRLWAFLFAFLFLVPSPPAASQSIFTHAGGAAADGRPAMASPLSVLEDVAIESEGNLFIADTESFRVRMVAADTGLMTAFAGNGVKGSSGDGGPATEASLHPIGVTIGPFGNVFIVDGEPEFRIRRIDRQTGVIVTVAGGGFLGGEGISAVEAGIAGATDAVLDSSGTLYIAHGGDTISRVDTNGLMWTVARLDGFVSRLALDDSSNSLFTSEDTGIALIRRIDLGTGEIMTVAGGGECCDAADGAPATSAYFGSIDGLALDAAGDLYVSDRFFHRVWRVDLSEQRVWRHAGTGGSDFDGDGGPAVEAAVNGPAGLAVDAQGALYIADSENRRVRRVGSDGVITTVAGVGASGFIFVGDGGPATNATLLLSSTFEFVAFNAVAVDPEGNLFVSDLGNLRMRRVSAADGTIETVAGSGRQDYFPGEYEGPATEVDLCGPAGLAARSTREIFFADCDVVLRLDLEANRLTRYAGGGASSDDGTPATEASLVNPSGLALDASGNLYIANRGGGRIVRVDAGTRQIATIGELVWPEGMAIGPDEHLYVADSFTRLVWRIDPATGDAIRAA